MNTSTTATVAPEVALDPIQGDSRSLKDWLTTFHLSLVALDPFKHESGLIIPTAARILANFSGSNCRMAWLVAGTSEQALEFLGPWTEDVLTFADPQRTAIKALGLAELPAFVHLNHGLEIVGLAQGWDPVEWQAVANTLARQTQWSSPDIPLPKDPPAYHGAPAV